MRRSVRGFGSASAVASIAFTFSAAHAGNLTYGVDAGVAESDNVTLAHTDKQSQTIAVTDLDFDYKQRSLRLDADAKGNFSYLDYLQNAYHNELLGRFDGTADLALIPQRLTWALQEDFGKMAIDPFTPSTPTNLENVNYVATGPDLSLRLGGTAFFDVSARVAEAHYQTSPFSNTRGMASVTLGEKLSALSSVSFNADSTRVLFQNTVVNTDFDRTNAFVRYSVKGARTQLSVDVGGTRVSVGSAPISGVLAKLELTRMLSEKATLNMTGGRFLTDGSASFSAQGAVAASTPGGATAASVTTQNYTSTYASVGWQYERNRTMLAVDARWERDVYSGRSALDRELTSAGLSVTRKLTPSLSVLFTGRYYKSAYPQVVSLVNGNAPSPSGGVFPPSGSVFMANGSPTADTGLVGAALTWRHGRALEVRLMCEHTSYTTSPNDTGYRESRIYLTVGYRPFRDATALIDVPGV